MELMRSTVDDGELQKQAETLRTFNRYYTTRLGLLGGRYLNSGFSLTEARILYELHKDQDMTAASLRGLLSLDAGYMSRLLSSLEKRRLVLRTQSPLDARSLLLRLTASGRRVAGRLDRQANQDMAILLKTLPVSDRNALAVSIENIQHILTSVNTQTRDESPVEVFRATLDREADAMQLLNEY